MHRGTEGEGGVFVGGAGDADVSLADYDDIDDFTEAVRERLAGRDKELVIDLCAEAGTAISPLDAARKIRGLLRQSQQTSLRIHASSQKAADAIARCLRPQFEGVAFVFGNLRVDVTESEITEVVADTVVNASNTRLLLGGGVSFALRHAAGPRLQAAMSALAPIGPTDIVETPSFDHARVRSILHVPTASGDPEVIRAAYGNVLRVVQAKGYQRVALPSLGTGTGGLDPRVGAQLLRQEMGRAAQGPALAVVLALFDVDMCKAFAEVLGAR
jgi:O-acetyl-ADP-ribose deacetylase (regulator of RNase III)